MAEGRRRTSARRDLERVPRFTELSPAPGRLDEAAWDRMLGEEPDAALRVLAAATGAVDPALARQARRLAGRVALRLGAPRRAGGPQAGRLALETAGADGGGDLDLDAAADVLVRAAAGGPPPGLDDLRARRFRRRGPAAVLVVDRSGSMGGERLATAALAASALAWRLGDRLGVVATAGDATVLKHPGDGRPAEAVVDDLLALRGHGSTDLVLGLRVAGRLLADVDESARTVVLLSDGRHNAAGDPAEAAHGLGRLVVVCPAGDAADAAALAAATGGRVVEVAGPAAVPAALAEALG